MPQSVKPHQAPALPPRTMPATKAAASVDTVAKRAKVRASWLRKISDGLTATSSAASKPTPRVAPDRRAGIRPAGGERGRRFARDGGAMVSVVLEWGGLTPVWVGGIQSGVKPPHSKDATSLLFAPRRLHRRARRPLATGRLHRRDVGG